MKIVFPLLGIVKGGGLRVLIELANGLCTRGHCVTLVVLGCEQLPFGLNAKIEIIYCKNRFVKTPLKQFVGFVQIFKSIPRNIDIVVSSYYLSSFIGYLLSFTSSVKHVYFIQGYEADFFLENRNIINRIKRVLAIISYKLPAKLITISGFLKNNIKKHTQKEITVISDGVDTSIFKPIDLCMKSTDKIIMTIASKQKRKGFDDFLSAIKLLREKRQDFLVRIVSADPTLKVDSSIPYETHYPKNDEELSYLYSTSSVFVSTSHLEGFGLPVLEAMASGVSVVTTDTGGINDFAINNINSLIVPIGDSAAIAHAITTLLDNNEINCEISRHGLKTASALTWCKMADKFEHELLIAKL